MTEARPRSCEAPSRRVFPARRGKTRCRYRPPDAADSGPDRLLIWHTPGAEADRLCFLRPVQHQFVDMCDDADNALEVPLHRRRRETHVAPVSNLVSVVHDAVDNGAVLPGKEAANIPFPCLVEITEGRDNSFPVGVWIPLLSARESVSHAFVRVYADIFVQYFSQAVFQKARRQHAQIPRPMASNFRVLGQILQSVEVGPHPLSARLYRREHQFAAANARVTSAWRALTLLWGLYTCLPEG